MLRRSGSGRALFDGLHDLARHGAATASLSMSDVPFDALFEARTRRHPMLSVPFPVHGAPRQKPMSRTLPNDRPLPPCRRVGRGCPQPIDAEPGTRLGLVVHRDVTGEVDTTLSIEPPVKENAASNRRATAAALSRPTQIPSPVSGVPVDSILAVRPVGYNEAESTVIGRGIQQLGVSGLPAPTLQIGCQSAHPLIHERFG